jgi:hypothetical protein
MGEFGCRAIDSLDTFDLFDTACAVRPRRFFILHQLGPRSFWYVSCVPENQRTQSRDLARLNREDDPRATFLNRAASRFRCVGARFKQKFNNSIEGKRTSEGFVIAVLQLSAVGCNDDNVRTSPFICTTGC